MDEGGEVWEVGVEGGRGEEGGGGRGGVDGEEEKGGEVVEECGKGA